MTGRTVIFMGGPLDGQAMPVTDRTVMAEWPGDPLAASRRAPVVYSTGQVVFCGRIIWVGYLGASPADDDLCRVLLSPAAQEAVTAPQPDD